MNHHFPVYRCCVLFCILFLTVSFKTSLKENTSEPKVIPKITNINCPGKKAIDDLYILEIKGEDFNAVKKDKLVFKFVRVREETLTLHGWRAHGAFGRTFDEEHHEKLELKPVIKSAIKYTSDIYFGDIVLSRKAVRKIKKLINKEGEYIIQFIPQLKPAPHLAYKVEVIKSNGATKQVVGTFNANPSPPKGFNNNAAQN